MDILKLKPVYKDYLWGGEKLKEKFNKNTNITPLAESWEVSTNPDGETTIENGKYKEMTLNEYIKINGKEVLGINSKNYNEFPILIKFIDALKNLSIQVHPSDEYAKSIGLPFGKTEMWVILDSEEDGFIYLGLKDKISKGKFNDLIEKNKLEEALNKFNVKKGESYFIPAGTIHGIGSGVTILEIQQNSNTTYRLFDYNRIDKNGMKRELHVTEGKKVSNLNKYILNNKKEGNILESCKYFTVEEYSIKNRLELKNDNLSFRTLNFVEGKGNINGINYKKGDSFFISADKGDLIFQGNGKFYLTRI